MLLTFLVISIHHHFQHGFSAGISCDCNTVPKIFYLAQHQSTDFAAEDNFTANFFKMLSEKTFPAASFIRSRADFDYIEEPDIFHEIFGHTPLLTDPGFAFFSQTIGELGLLVQPPDYSWLIRLYWFTIEFGLSREQGQYRALGSGLNSSPTELVYAVESSAPERREFNVIDILRTPYRIDIHQPIYYVIEDINDLFKAADRNLLADIKQAQSLGLFEPAYDCQLTG